jgi:E3 ubiquitin-protein ligase synoviolin
MDQIPPPGPPALFHIRTSLIITLLTIADLVLVTYSLESILLDGVSAMVLFASEFMILLASIGGTTARYVVGLVDLRRARGRVDLAVGTFMDMGFYRISPLSPGADMPIDFVKLLTYLSFFAVILLHYGLPLHILRDVYMTLRSFLGRVGDLIRYRRATRDMDALYPDATPEEVERTGDRTCIICREEMVSRDTVRENGERANGDGGPNETPKRLACGHVFHFHCLRSWLERQQSCPTW